MPPSSIKPAREPTPPANAFSHQFVVQPADIDELGHAGNVTCVRWVNAAAAAHSESVGLGLEAYRDLGVVWVVRKHEIEYLGEALEGQTLHATTWVENLRGATSLRRTRIERPGEGRALVRAATTWALISMATRRPTRIPQELLARYGF